MLSFLRRLTHSKVGVIVTLALLVLIALAFAAGDITRFGGGAGSTVQAGDTVATVGDTKISADQLKGELQSELNAYRQQNPQLTMAQYIQGGGFDATVGRLIDSLALEKFAQKQGMSVSKKAIDGVIAGIPAFQGPNGKFDPALYQQLLQQQRLTDAGVRAQIRQQIYAQMLTDPTRGATQMPEKLALPYASLLLERRTGSIGYVPAAQMPAAASRTSMRFTWPSRKPLIRPRAKSHINRDIGPRRRSPGPTGTSLRAFTTIRPSRQSWCARTVAS